MIFPEYAEPLQLWRMTASSGYRSDRTWTYITTITGRCEPLKASEEFQNNQMFANVSETLFLPIETKTIVKANDGIMDADGIQRKIVGQPEIWKAFLPHVACMLERAQWAVPS